MDKKKTLKQARKSKKGMAEFIADAEGKPGDKARFDSVLGKMVKGKK